jgi:predicted NUDIX family NTP pyrophosphohydrolase
MQSVFLAQGEFLMKIIVTNKLSFVLLFAFLSMSCGSTATNNNQAANASAVSNTNTVANETPAAGAAAATQVAPEAVVAELYKQHDGKKSPFFQDKDRGAIDKYFSKSLGDMIWKDAVTSHKEEGVGAIDFDPLYNAQDVDIKNLKVGTPDVKGDKATVPVTFDNFGKKQTVKFLMAQEKGAWKINDIDYGDGFKLTKVLNEEYSSKVDAPVEGNFEGKYQVGDTTCTVKAVKMAFEVKWAKGSGVEMFFSQGRANDKEIFSSDPETGKANSFAFDDENYNTGIFYRADGKEFPIKRAK